MKKNLFFAIAIVAMLFTTSCRQVCLDNPLDRSGQVIFTGAVGSTPTRVVGDMWSGNESIGVFATTTNTLAESDIYADARNRQFTNANIVTANATFTAATGQEILFPLSGADIHFFAYYPFQPTATAGITTDFRLPINTTTQNLTALDLMWATSSGNNNNATVGLGFTRRMSQVQINVTTGTGWTNLDGLTVTIEGLYRQAYLDLANGNVITRTDMGDITPVMTFAAGNVTATANAIVIPGQNIGGTGIVFRFTQGTRELTWTPPTPVMMEGGRRYVYHVQLSATAASSVELGATIVDWIEPVMVDGPVTLHPPTFSVDQPETMILDFEAVPPTTVNVTAPVGQAWTVESSDTSWLTVNTGGTGNGTFTFEATENTTNADRRATITVTPTGTTNFDPIVITVTQEPRLLFPGANFSNWDAFTSSLAGSAHSSVSIIDGAGMTSSSNALNIAAAFTSNTLLFSANFPVGSLVGMSYIEFHIKGTTQITTTNRSLAIGLSPAGSNTQTEAFNLLIVEDTDVTLVSNGSALLYGAPPPASNPPNPGWINTTGWTRVRLDLSTATPANIADAGRIQFRAGGATVGGNVSTWNVSISNIILVP